MRLSFILANSLVAAFPAIVLGSTLAISGPPTKSFKITSALNVGSASVTRERIESSSGPIAPYTHTTDGTTINRTCFETKHTVTKEGQQSGTLFSLTLPSYPDTPGQSLFPTDATITCTGNMSPADLQKVKELPPSASLFMPEVKFVPVESQQTSFEYTSALDHQSHFNGGKEPMNSGTQWKMTGKYEQGATLSFVAPSVEISGQGSWSATLPAEWRCTVNNPAGTDPLVPGFFMIQGFTPHAKTVTLDGQLWWSPHEASSQA